MAKTQTNTLTKAIINYLLLRGHYAVRNNNNGVYDPIKKIFRRNSVTPGMPDIVGFTKDGQYIGVEVKTGRDVQSEFQKRFQAECEQRGAIYILARSVDNVIDAGL